jgi:Ca-activated chloride channel family protein
MKKGIWHFGCVVALLGLTGLAPSEVPRQEPFTISDNVNLVLLDVSVKDSHVGYVPDLQKSDFQVFDNGKKQAITQFANVDSPVTVGLVVDNSGSMHSKRAEVLQAGLAFAHESNTEDEFFVVNFNNLVASGLPPQMPFTDNLQVLHKALYYGKPSGQTALYDAISFSLRHLELAHREQRTLIVVSDGGDNVSKTSLPELLDQIDSSRATIYTIGLIDPANNDLKPGVLRKLAAISGGSYFQPRALDEVRNVFSQISQDIRHRYTIGFVPNEHDKRVIRNVKVTAQREGRRLTCKTRSTYRIPSDAGKV